MQTTEETPQELPEELQEQMEQLIAEKNRRIDAFGRFVLKIKDEAVKTRKSSGIENQWTGDENYYDGVDEYNHPAIKNSLLKPRSPDGVVTERRNPSDSGSTAFINITAPFTDYASARMGDILLPANEWNFKIKPTPVPELDRLVDSSDALDNQSVIVDHNGNQIQFNPAERAREEKKKIAEKVEKAETRIKDWLTECQYKSESRKVIENAAKVGTGILKGPVPEIRTEMAFSDGALQIVKSLKPSSRCVSHWNVYPDMRCGENIHDGSYFIERDYLTTRQLMSLPPEDGYIQEAIRKVVKEGPRKKYTSSNDSVKDDDLFEIWYCYVDISPDDLALLDEDYAEKCECSEEMPTMVSAVVVLVNDSVIKAYMNPQEVNKYPFDFMVWRRVTDMPFGVGIPRQGRKAQDMLNASVRALLDNMGLSAIPMIAMLRSALQPADGSWRICKGKVWFLDETKGVADIRQAIQTLVIPTMQNELMANIELAMKFMEDITGITFLLQGQQGSAPDTVGGMNLLHQNASTVLRRCARIFDENITEPHIRRYHEYLLIDPDVPDDEKGDLKIEAVGSSHLVEREIQSMQLPAILQLISSNPQLEKSPRKAVDEILRAYKFDPSKFDMDEEEKQQMAEAAQGQTAPQVQAAQIRAQTDLQKEQMRQEANMQKIQVDMDRDRVFADGVTQRNQMAYEKNIADTQLRIQEMELKLQLAQLDYASKHNITLEKVKADLARDVMKLNLQKELAYNDDARAAEQVITPPSEPAGRAPDGQAFQK